MGFFTGTAGLRRGLVALLLVALAACAYPQDTAPRPTAAASPAAERLPLKRAAEVLDSRCSRIHENPVNLLFLLPGVLFLLVALTTRRRGSLLIFMVAILLGAAGDPPGDDVGELVAAAERDFDAGRVEEALALYAQANSRLPCNPALEYNLGICHADQGQTGYAVYHLRRSLRFRPADDDSRRALEIVQQQAGLEGQMPMPVAVNPDVLFVITLVLANLSLGAAGFALRRKGVHALIAMILLTIAAGVSVGFFVGLLYSESRSVGVVVSAEVGLMKIPEDDSRPNFVLPPGTSLRIRGRAVDYYLVETASRFRGWVRAEAILRGDSP